jgi:hypothetical protein
LHAVTACADDEKVSPKSWYDLWLDRVTEIQSVQPHWVTPLVTVTPRLEQEFRTDFVQESSPKGHGLSNFGNGKGLELIPVDKIEIVLDVPAYLEHNNSKIENGFGDFALLIKYRILSANETDGNYILTAFLGVSFPTGTATNGTSTTVFTPTIAGGKGLGRFDVQSTLGISIPATGLEDLGRTLTWHTALQYHVPKFFLWPEIEDNFSHFVEGENAGKTQNYITPGLMVGRLPIHERTGLTFGGGYQVATSDYKPYQHAWILSARVPF